MIKRIAHVCLLSHDLAVTESFYCEALGLGKAFNFLRNGTIIGFYLKVSENMFIEVFHHDGVERRDAYPIQHLCLECDDLDALAARLKAHGQEVSPKTMGADRSWQMWVMDPSGVRIEFHQYTDRSCQRTLADCVLD